MTNSLIGRKKELRILDTLIASDAVEFGSGVNVMLKKHRQG